MGSRCERSALYSDTAPATVSKLRRIKMPLRVTAGRRSAEKALSIATTSHLRVRRPA